MQVQHDDQGPPAGWGRLIVVSSVCCVLGLLIYLTSFGISLEQYHDQPPTPVLVVFGVDAVLGIVGSLAIGPLRRAGVWNLLYVPFFGLSSWLLPAAVIALVRTGAQRVRLVWVVVGLLLVVTSAGYVFLSVVVDDADVSTMPFELAVLWLVALALLLWGRVRGTRAALIESLRQRAHGAERERAAAEREHAAELALVRSRERVALARDVHDSLSHQLALIAVYAGGLTYRDDVEPEQVRATARLLRDAASDANAELREVLSALRSDSEGTAPLPTAAEVETVVAAARAGGQPVTLTWQGLTPAELDAAPRPTTVAVERILSELLVNADKHAPGERVAVLLSRGVAGDLRLTVRNPVGAGRTAPGSGFGLVGVEERARLLGGEMVVRRDRGHPEKEFEVEVWLPWNR